MPDVLDPISDVVGRKVAFADQPKTEQPAGKDSLESIIGRKPEEAKIPDLMMSRFSTYANARRNGIEPTKAIDIAKQMAGTMAPRTRSVGERVSDFISRVPVAPGKTLGDVGRELGQINQRLWNPELMTDEQWEAAKKEHSEWVDKYVLSPEARTAWQSAPGIGELAKSDTLWKIGAGAAQHLMEFGQEQALSPAQVALAVGTFGESSLVRAAYKVAPSAVPAARVVSKVLQAQFISQDRKSVV